MEEKKNNITEIPNGLIKLEKKNSENSKRLRSEHISGLDKSNTKENTTLKDNRS